MHIGLTVAGEIVQIFSGLHGGHAVSKRVDLAKHLERQENYIVTMSTFQGLYGAQLSSEVWRFQLMSDTNELLTRWNNAEKTYGITLLDYRKDVRNGGKEFEVPSVVAELGKEELRVGPEMRCFRWAIPEVKTHEEAAGALVNEKVGKTTVTVPELKKVMDNWWATWRKLGSPSHVNSFDEDEMRSMETCNEMKDWMLGFHIVFVLKEGPIKQLILKLMLLNYEGTDVSAYNKEIHGCTCGTWHRYFICTHSMAFNIIRKALPYPMQWDPRKFKGVVRNDVSGPQRKMSKVANALKPADARFLCWHCCRLRQSKKRKKKPVKQYENTTPNRKRRKVTISSVTSAENLTPKTPVKGRKKRENDCENGIQKEKTHSASETEEEEEENEEGTDNIGLRGKVQGRVGQEFEEEEDDVTRSGPCEECCNKRVKVRKDLMGKCDGKEHTLPEALYNEGFRCVMTLRSSTQHERGMMEACGSEPQERK